MSNDRPLILVSNDDGYRAKGIASLIAIASDYGDVVAVAPASHQSGKSSAITVDVPLRARVVSEREGVKVYMVNGTPVDCVKLAFDCLLPKMPDLVLSGINHGFNSGNSVIYSGTMGVVFEGSFRGVPSVGFSYGVYTEDADFSPCEVWIRRVIEKTMRDGLPEGVCLNVNFPACEEILGIKTVKASNGYWREEFEERIDPHGRPYYWLTGKYFDAEPDSPATDNYWLDRGYATVVPCRADQTAYDQISQLNYGE